MWVSLPSESLLSEALFSESLTSESLVSEFPLSEFQSNSGTPSLSFLFPWSFRKYQGKPQKHQGFLSPCEPLKTLENRQKTPPKTKEFRSKKNTKETKTPRKRRTGLIRHPLDSPQNPTGKTGDRGDRTEFYVSKFYSCLFCSPKRHE